MTDQLKKPRRAKLTDLIVDQAPPFDARGTAVERKKRYAEGEEAARQVGGAKLAAWNVKEQIAWGFADRVIFPPHQPSMPWVLPFVPDETLRRDLGSRFGAVNSPFQPRFIVIPEDKREEPEFHPGVDFNLESGTQLQAVADGVVTSARLAGGGGQTIVIDHGDDYFTQYMHLHKFLVAKGDKVKAKQIIAESGGDRRIDPPEKRGSSSGAHLHFGVCYKGEWNPVIDPVLMYTLFSEVPRFGGPFDWPGRPPNIWRSYANNESPETGVGGYYAMGLRRNYHGGVHVFPEGGRETEVRAMAPGFIVAARLPGQGSKALHADLLGAIGNWPGFVLVRHDLEELKADGQKGDKGTFFSLYMHLQSPKYKPDSTTRDNGEAPSATLDSTDAFTAKVPWFRSLAERRYGAFVHCVEEPPPAKGANPAQPLGSVLWSAEKVEAGGDGAPTKNEYQVTDKQVKSITLHSPGPQPTSTGQSSAGSGDSQRVEWIYKPSPGELMKAFNELAWGSVVTFPEPFFPVKAGDVLGLVGPIPPGVNASALEVWARLVDATGAVPVDADQRPAPARKLTMGSSFLHWQVFAPDGANNGIELLKKLSEQVTSGAKVDPSLPTPTAPVFSAIEDTNKDCHIDVSEMKSQLKPALPSRDQAAFETAFEHLDDAAPANFSYARPVVELIDGKTSFGPRPEKIDWEPGCKYKYPLLLQLEKQFLLPPDKNSLANGKYTLNFSFTQLVGDKEVPLTCTNLCDRSLCSTPSAATCSPKPFEITPSLFKPNEKLLTFNIMVPAAADRMTVNFGPGAVGEAADTVAGSDLTLLKDALAERWRGSVLKQLNEYSVDSVAKIEKALKGHIEFTGIAKEFAWCDPAKEVAIQRHELSHGTVHYVKQQAQKALQVFKGKDSFLPSGAMIKNLHPVTAVWLLNLLDIHKKAALVEGITAKAFREEDPEPLSVAWVTKAREPEPQVGGHVNVLVVDDDFGEEDKNTVTVLAQGKGKLELATVPYQPGGLALASVSVCFWGDWSVTTRPAPKGKATYGTQKLSIPPLQFDSPQGKAVDDPHNAPGKGSAAMLSWLLKVKKPVQAIEGYLYMQVRKLDGQWPSSESTHENGVIPALALPLLPVSSDDGKGVPKDVGAFEVKDGFITGLKDPKAKDASVSASFRLSEYRQANSDILVACSLLDALLQIRAEFKNSVTIESIAADGLSMVLRPTRPPAVPRTGVPTSVLGPSAGKATGVSASPMNDKLDRVTITVAGGPKHLTLCKTLESCRSALRTTTDGGFVLDVAANVGSFAPAEIRTACTQGGFMLALTLARALEYLVTKLGRFNVVWLARDGLTCRINKATPAAETFARDCGLFSAVRVETTGLVLTVGPDAERFMTVQFDPSPLLGEFAQRSDIKPGEQYQYRFFFETLNGLKYLVGADGSRWPSDSRALLNRSIVDALTRSAPERLTYGPSGPAPDLFSKVAVDGLVLTWLTSKGVSGIEARFSCLGRPEDWQPLTVKVSVSTGGPFSVVSGCASLKRPKEQFVLSVMVPVPSRDKAYAGTVKVKVEVETKGKADPRVPAVEKNIDCEPKLLGPLELDDSNPDELIIRCKSLGMELPEMVNGKEAPVGMSREFVLEVTDLTAVGTTARQAKAPQLPAITYTVPGNGTGFLKGGPEAGLFEARVAKVARGKVAPMLAGHSYQFTLGRPRTRGNGTDPGGKDRAEVRGKPIPPVSCSYTFNGPSGK